MQGVEIYFGYQVTMTRPMVRRDKWAQVKVVDLEYEEEYRFKTEHVVLNVPATVRESTSRNAFDGTIRWWFA